MVGRWRNAQPLGALGDGRIVDRLDVDRMPLEQEIARALAALRITDKHRYDVRIILHDRQAGGCEHRLCATGAVLMALALPIEGLEVADRGAPRHTRRAAARL